MGTAAAVAVAIASLYFLFTGSKRQRTKVTHKADSKVGPNQQKNPAPLAHTSSQNDKQDGPDR